MTSVMGIDPGIKGAIACFDNNEEIHLQLLESMDYDLFRRTVHTSAPNHIFLEKAHAMPKQGVTSMFNYGVGFGKIIGWIDSLIIPYTLVLPQTWTKIMHQGCAGKDSKAKSWQAAQRLFPTVELKATERCKKPHMGLVDALLIAEYGRRMLK